MRNEAGIKFDCIFEEPLDFIDINYTHLNKTVRYEIRPHGEWKNGKCTNCGAECFEDDYMRDIETDFCHRCGADMRDKKDDLAGIIEAVQSMKEGAKE